MRPFFLALFLVVFCSWWVSKASSYQHTVTVEQQRVKGQQNLESGQQRVFDRCTASKPPVGERRCRARLRRYYYNTTTSRCMRFYYDGCSAGPNNFEKKKTCKKVCEAEGMKSGFYNNS
ncbi:Kunitz/Bovine pancreatic trypsin inhibitor domain protein [Ancylostoma ceylanicum]|uniref:Kunitz/Bovine pancreatic trypsin inhibitor domain protein n=2 Tax=Ancylostoma ceylanicum TaxID=53326 RepID=A0A0D6LKF5_9BILA|nr:Kunitz/Bovine pancreatic trypsin inhibitor domain protein [Ancylostoma ceylanicum]EYC17056.1 hypothetical protein Y032_0031g2252 [Ancylostoma ceylanicum]